MISCRALGGICDASSDSVDYLNDEWFVKLPIPPCCCEIDDTCNVDHLLKISDINSCLPSSFDWIQHSSVSNWSGRSGHVTVHEPPSSRDEFNSIGQLREC